MHRRAEPPPRRGPNHDRSGRHRRLGVGSLVGHRLRRVAIAGVIATLMALVGSSATAAEPATASALSGLESSYRVAPPVVGAPASDDESGPATTIADDFLPPSRDLSECIGLTERPGCGSKARGGWRQTLTFGLIIVGMGFIFWRASIEVRRHRRSVDR